MRILIMLCMGCVLEWSEVAEEILYKQKTIHSELPPRKVCGAMVTIDTCKNSKKENCASSFVLVSRSVEKGRKKQGKCDR